MKKFSMLFLIILGSLNVFSAEAPLANEPSIGLSTTETLIVATLIFALILLFVTIVLLNAFKVMIKVQSDPLPPKRYVSPKKLEYEDWVKLRKGKPSIWTKILGLKPIEEETSIIIPHAYDGIHELNNPVPRWFNVLFYGTMIFAACYLYYYHIGDGPRQDQEYVAEIEKAAAEKTAFLAQAAEKFDENTIKIDKDLVANGKTIFMGNCIACHGEHGQGIVGPNLADEYWLHGGSISDVFKTVKYGVPEKGMASWEKNLSAKSIAEVVNFIMSLQGTKPANAKAPQGEKYEPKSVKDTVQKNETIAKN